MLNSETTGDFAHHTLRNISSFYELNTHIWCSAQVNTDPSDVKRKHWVESKDSTVGKMFLAKMYTRQTHAELACTYCKRHVQEYKQADARKGKPQSSNTYLTPPEDITFLLTLIQQEEKWICVWWSANHLISSRHPIFGPSSHTHTTDTSETNSQASYLL